MVQYVCMLIYLRYTVQHTLYETLYDIHCTYVREQSLLIKYTKYITFYYKYYKNNCYIYNIKLEKFIYILFFRMYNYTYRYNYTYMYTYLYVYV